MAMIRFSQPHKFSRRGLSVLFVALPIGFALTAHDQGKPIDTQRSILVIHVGKAGLFSGAAHEHWVNAPIANGIVDEADAVPSVRFVVDAAKLTVMADKNISAKDLAEVQSNMENKVLESSKYPNIAFQSTRVQGTGDDAWKVAGDLTLHGVARPVIVDISREGGAYVGTAYIKQSDFGIHPIQVGGGLVKVKDELEIRFRVFTKIKPSGREPTEDNAYDPSTSLVCSQQNFASHP
jgi:hypothetical protein